MLWAEYLIVFGFEYFSRTENHWGVAMLKTFQQRVTQNISIIFLTKNKRNELNMGKYIMIKCPTLSASNVLFTFVTSSAIHTISYQNICCVPNALTLF